MSIIPARNVLQEVGKVVTYLRRYGIVSVLRLSAEEDIDGNSTEQAKRLPNQLNGTAVR